MSFLVSYIIGEVVMPLIFGIGWSVVYFLTLGRVKPKKKTFYKYPMVALLGVYTACATPPLIYLGIKSLGLIS